jgi:hypothetical protein
VLPDFPFPCRNFDPIHTNNLGACSQPIGRSRSETLTLRSIMNLITYAMLLSKVRWSPWNIPLPNVHSPLSKMRKESRQIRFAIDHSRRPNLSLTLGTLLGSLRVILINGTDASPL